MGTGGRGQASVETAGIVVVVALALAATGAWLVANARPPARPPQVVEQVARPLRFPDNVRLFDLPAVPLGGEGGDEPVGDVLRSAGRAARDVGRAYIVGRREFEAAYYRRLRERLAAAWRDPAGELAPAAPDVLTPEGLAGVALRDWARARDYVDRVRGLPPGERARTVLRDAGERSADASIEVLKALLRRGLARAARRPPPSPPPASAP